MMTLIIPRKEAPVSGEGTVVIPQPAGDEPVIKNTFFFPDIDPKRVRERMRLEQTVAPARLREAIKSGMAETNAELYEYREQKIAAGFTRLADVPADDIDGESIKVFYYERAVCAMATASLYERYRGVDASAKGDKKADSIDSTIDELWRDMRWAVAGLFLAKHENASLRTSLDRANNVANGQQTTITMLKNQLHVALTRADKNELAQVALRQELENAAKREAQREKTITRLLNENEDFRRWYGAGLPDAVRRLHQRPACTDASDCRQRLPESEPLPDAGQ